MNKIAKQLTALLLSLLLLTALLVPAQAGYSEGAKLVVLGDSIAAGTAGTTDISKSYGALLAAEHGFDLSNFAVNGYAANDLLSLLADNAAARQALHDADIINLSIGGNDLLAENVITIVLKLIFLKDDSIVDPYIEAFAVKFAKIIEEIRILNSDALLVVQNLYNCMEGIPLVGDAYELALQKLNKVYVDYLAAHPGAYELADIYTAYKGREGLVFDDRLHPSDAGHARIAEVLEGIMLGSPLTLEAIVTETPGFFRQIGIFFTALKDYLGYWLSVLSFQQLMANIFGFIF